MKTLSTLSLIIFPMFLFATTYTTLQNGAWSNTTNVWSTDGTTPCLCMPSYTLSGDTLVMNHDISISSNINVTNLSFITIQTGRSFMASGYTVELIDGKIISDGPLVIKKLTVDAGSSVEIYNSEIEIEFRMEIFGDLILNASVLEVNGNIIVYDSGTLDISNSSKLGGVTGNFTNTGTVNIGPASCLQLSVGNVRNNAPGVFTGSGSIISDFGNINNSSVWSLALKWCSAGADVGMPTVEDCTGANLVCDAFVLLPIQLTSFIVSAEEGYNHIEWITASEINCDYFEIIKSVDGDTWTSIGSVNGNGNSTAEINYEFRDSQVSGTITYYQLVQYDFDGKKNYSPVISVVNNKQNEASVYPNPGKDNFSILFGDQKVESITILDINGAVVYKEIIEQGKDFVNVSPDLSSGVYYLNLIGIEEVNTISLFVQK